MADRGVNRVTLVGNLGQAPEVRYMPKGGAVANLTLATSETWRDKQTGEQRENTEWHRVVLFGKLAEIAGEYLQKGSQVYIEGQLRTRNWQDDAGVTRYITEIVVGQKGTLQMLGSRRDSTSPQQGSQQNSSPSSSPAPQDAPSAAPSPKKGRSKKGKSPASPAPQQPPQGAYPPMDWDDDQIPF